MKNCHAALETPYKEIAWFERSAHSPSDEQPDNFTAALARIKSETLP
ncbi:MAG: hypothetical protein GX881_05025 [Firmicutes bacterium]|nr:hypothetical protein [Bacillota bacterium]